MGMLLQLSLCVVTVIQLTSSQSTYDVLQDENDVNSCGGTEQVLRQLVTAVSQLQKAIMQLQRDAAGGNQRNGLKDCPDDFTYISSVNGCYKVVTRGLNWITAGAACRSLHKDAHLLTINDADEQYAVKGMLASTNQTTLSGCNLYDFWTAGQRIYPSRNSSFVWRMSSTYSRVYAMTYTNWLPGQPDYAGGVEECLQFSRFGWNDADCSRVFCYICELDVGL